MADKIFDGQTTNGDSERFFHIAQQTGMLHFYIEGDLGGGTLILHAIGPDGETPSVVAGAEAITSIGLKIIQCLSMEGYLELIGSSGADLTVYTESEHDAMSRVRKASNVAQEAG